MRRFKLNHWFVNDNVLNISLMRYYVDINVSLNDDNEMVVVLRVIDSNQKELLFNFDSIEIAVAFTEGVIDKCPSYEVIEEAYNKYYATSKGKTFTKTIN